jgi:hypothetical protein
MSQGLFNDITVSIEGQTFNATTEHTGGAVSVGATPVANMSVIVSLTAIGTGTPSVQFHLEGWNERSSAWYRSEDGAVAALTYVFSEIGTASTLNRFVSLPPAQGFSKYRLYGTASNSNATSAITATASIGLGWA